MSFRFLAFAGVFAVASVVLAQTNQLEVSNAWARATPGKAENGAAYVTIVSPTPPILCGHVDPAELEVTRHVLDEVDELKTSADVVRSSHELGLAGMALQGNRKAR